MKKQMQIKNGMDKPEDKPAEKVTDTRIYGHRTDPLRIPELTDKLVGPEATKNLKVPEGKQIQYHWFTPYELVEDLERVRHDGRRRPRSITKKKIEGFARAMVEKRWRHDSAEPMKYDDRGLLMDGFHRAHAVIRAGIPVLMEIRTEMDPKVEPILDSGTVKSRTHALQQKGFKYAASLSSACGAIWCFERKITHLETYVDNQQVCEIAEKYTDLDLYVGDVSSHVFVRSGLVIGALYWIECARPRKGAEFVNAFLTGAEGDQTLKITDRRYILREIFIKGPELNSFKRRNTAVSVLFRTFQAWLKGVPGTRIKFTMDENNFPWPEGAPYLQ